MDIDQLQLNFNPTAQHILQFVLAFVMYSVAIDTSIDDFRSVLRRPKAFLIGALGQLLLFPALTFLLVGLLSWLGWPQLFPSAILGMYLIAACPGGNISNFLTHVAGGNTALSVSLSACSTLLAVVSTPLNFSIWASLTPSCSAALTSVNLSFSDLAGSVFFLLLLPMLVGLSQQRLAPAFTQRIRKITLTLASIFFLTLVVGALAANWQNFWTYIGYVAAIVMLQNSMGLLAGYLLGRLTRLAPRDSRTISIEVGIQNSGLAMLLALQFFPNMGGMAFIAAWWSIWHAISGGLLALYWRKTSSPHHNN